MELLFNTFVRATVITGVAGAYSGVIVDAKNNVANMNGATVLNGLSLTVNLENKVVTFVFCGFKLSLPSKRFFPYVY